MKYELFDYQEEAKAATLRALAGMARAYSDDPEERGAFVLAAPTGAGKTVIATAVIEAALDGDETTPGIEGSTFLWVTDDPSLNRQTLQKMVAASSGLAPNRLITIESDFDQEVLDPGRVYFLNIQKLGSSTTLSKSNIDGRRYSFWETIANTVRKRPHGFVVVVDEAHRGLSTARDNRNTIVSRIIGGGTNGTSVNPEVPAVWGISAVPRRFREEMAQRGRIIRSHSVAVEDVRASGLLKDQVVLGHTKGIEAAESTLLRRAVDKIREYEARWSGYCKTTGEARVDPILVVQIEDKPSAKDLAEVVGTVLEEWPGISAANIAHTFASHSLEKVGIHHIAYCPPEDIEGRQDIRVVLCKTAITTGWDCPRAEVLVSMRVAKDVDLITQIMGRMVRTPLARRVLTDESLNTVYCILPKFDKKAVDQIAQKFEEGSEGSLASGTTVITSPVELARNPLLGGNTPRQTFRTAPSEATGQDGDDARQPDTNFWFDQDQTDRQPNVPGTRASSSSANPLSVTPSRKTTSHVTPDLFEEPEVTQNVAPQGSDDVFRLLESLPSYTIPRRIRRSGIFRLASLSVLLAEKHGGRAIEPSATRQAKNELLAVIETFRANLEARGELESRIGLVTNTQFFERTVSFGTPTVNPHESQTLIELDNRGIHMLMEKAKRLLPEGLAMEYVGRLADADEDVTEAMITTIALAQDPELPRLVEERASQIVATWLQKHSSAITRLSPADQEKFDRIRRESDRPLPTTFSLPNMRTEDAEGKEWERHVLSDSSGIFRATFAEWEEHVLREELSHGAVAWYRNPVGGRHSLQIPYVAVEGIKGLSPDFIFVHRVRGELRASLIDPHGTHLADAVPKLQGLAEYAETHKDDFQRIQSVAKVDGSYLMINHQDAATRNAVKAYSGTDAAEIFRIHGSDY
ncbi:DEAD/DEAH box helicase [Streptomyces sp. 8N616]|uniref:DEAD/DEAH box helicase n=1 Tax=Streptomyces sp. 8N616 TaxID=3457414 RepID=UPI003FD0C834